MDAPTHKGPSNWCCCQQQEGGRTPAVLAPGGTSSWGTAWLRTGSTHFALEAEPRQDAALGPSSVCPGRGTPQCGAASWPWCGLGGDYGDQQPPCCLGALQPISWLWLGAKAWAGSILPACSTGQGMGLTSPFYARTPWGRGGGDPQPPASLAVPACSHNLSLP